MGDEPRSAARRRAAIDAGTLDALARIEAAQTAMLGRLDANTRDVAAWGRITSDHAAWLQEMRVSERADLRAAFYPAMVDWMQLKQAHKVWTARTSALLAGTVTLATLFGPEVRGAIGGLFHLVHP